MKLKILVLLAGLLAPSLAFSMDKIVCESEAGSLLLVKTSGFSANETYALSFDSSLVAIEDLPMRSWEQKGNLSSFVYRPDVGRYFESDMGAEQNSFKAFLQNRYLKLELFYNGELTNTYEFYSCSAEYKKFFFWF